MNTLPTISIVTPSFNQAPFLEECIDSILSQNYPNLEYIIMDGGSTDGSVEIIKKYARHLTYWQSQPDGGQYAAINEGFTKTTGEIMAWLNSDDKLHSGSLKIVGGVFKHFEGIDWLTGRPTAWDENGFLSYVANVLPQWTLEKCLNRQVDDAFIQQESTFWRRSLWGKSGGLSSRIQFAADFELWIRFFRYANLFTVDALLGGFRHHSGQKTANFMNEYNQEVSAVIHAAKEADKISVAETEKSAQIIVTRRTLLDLNIIDRCAITIATSIIPRNFELQRTAIDSWRKLGFKVISLNSAAEASLVAENFPDIPLTIVNRTAEAATGRPYIFFDDVMEALSAEGAAVCGIVNSDIVLTADADFADFIAETVGNGLLFGSRLDVDAMADLDGEKFIYGFDFFFFNKAALKIFPEAGFCLGVPWWDYWAPFVPLITGLSCKELISPVAFHVKHETKWAGELYCDYGKMFADRIAPLARDTEFAGRITGGSSPEQLTVFSFDILHYILKNSDKVFYPRADAEAGRIEVGQRQYLAMREKVIEHHRRIWELNEQIKLQSTPVIADRAEIESLHSSLSWRITRPLRWAADRLRALGSGEKREG